MTDIPKSTKQYDHVETKRLLAMAKSFCPDPHAIASGQATRWKQLDRLCGDQEKMIRELAAQLALADEVIKQSSAAPDQTHV
jgi:hypothetical protein